MQFRKLVCDNLGGNKPSLSSAKEKAGLRCGLGEAGNPCLCFFSLHFGLVAQANLTCREKGAQRSSQVTGTACLWMGLQGETNVDQYVVFRFQRMQTCSLQRSAWGWGL